MMTMLMTMATYLSSLPLFYVCIFSCFAINVEDLHTATVTTTQAAAATTTTTNATNASRIKPPNRSQSVFDTFQYLESTYGPLPPLAQRTCSLLSADFVCAYGNCSQLDSGGVKCVCHQGFSGALCDEGCPINCGEHGECIHDKFNNTYDCYCYDDYTGPNCTELWMATTIPYDNPNKNQWLWILGIVVVFLIAVMAAGLVIVLYRRRNIAIMKCVYWLQPFEEDDNREYDAFVSYASTDQDRQFVLQVLIPKLEGRMCFNLCIHQRNFIAGQYITDNIVDSVKRSRRTLLILSPSFIDSGWCKFEYQTALQEMLNEKHRVLPIIIEDISKAEEKMDRTLSRILRTVTWLEYPTKDARDQDFEKFWKRLQLSMPKKRSNQVESGKVQSCLAKQVSHLPLKSLHDDKLQDHQAVSSTVIAIPRQPASNQQNPVNDLSMKDETRLKPTLDTISVSQRDTDSKNETVSSLESETGLWRQDPNETSSDNCKNGTTNLQFNVLDAGPDNDDSEISSTQNVSEGLQISSPNSDYVNDNVTTDDSEDIPNFMLENYIGCISPKKNRRSLILN